MDKVGNFNESQLKMLSRRRRMGDLEGTRERSSNERSGHKLDGEKGTRR